MKIKYTLTYLLLFFCGSLLCSISRAHPHNHVLLLFMLFVMPKILERISQ